MAYEEAISTEEVKNIPWYKLFNSKDAILLLTINSTFISIHSNH